MQRTIDVHISDLLYHQECVVIPTFGAFLAQHFSAEVNPSTHMMRPAGKRVSFNARVNQNDGLLANHISQSESISYNEALESISISVRGWKRMLRSGKKVTLPLVGKLYLDAEGRVQFNPSLEINYDVHAFGLGIFRAPSAPRELAIEQSINQVIEKHKTDNGGKINYRPIIRWAAAIGAFVALGVYASSAFGDFEKSDFSSLFSFSNTKAQTEQVETVQPYTLETIEIVGSLFEVDDISEEPELKAKADERAANEENTVMNTLDEVYKKNDKQQSAYHIIVGSFKEQANAEQYVNSLTSVTNEAYIAKGNSSFYRVAVGGFKTRAQADKMLAQVKAQINSAAWVYRN